MHRPAALTGLALALLLTGACNRPDGTPGAPPAAPSASAAGNTAEICASGGTKARDVVVDLFTQLAGAGKDGEPTEADLTKIYQDTFGRLSDDLAAEAARATDPGLATVLNDIAAEAGEIAAAPDPSAAGNEDLQAALTKLDGYCPTGDPSSSASTAPGGVVAGAVGAKGSGCELPVTFTVAEKWKPKAVEVADDDPLAELARKGPLRMACEIDGKPAGHLGFIRVWVDPAATGDARAALQPMLTGEKTRKVTWTPFTAAGRPAAEVAFEQYRELTEEYAPRRAFAVVTPAGAVVVELGGLDAEEHAAMLPAYELARGSVTVRP